ncbi:helix-turn-helix domain-containing protein [Candidatus Woesearchaeota archaeon]|nr:helix-turn-helix domain-containing protein [Candidatus Woesearchaeota archaeon]
MVKKEMLAYLIDDKKAAILRLLLNSSEELYLKEIADRSGVSLTSTYRTLQDFVGLGLVGRREWKTSKVYRMEANDKTAFLKELLHEEYDGVPDFVDAVGGMQGVESVLLQGVRKKGKANILIIGQGIEGGPVEEIAKRIKDKGFDLSFLTLTQNQYEQMMKMGLYAGEKVVLK